jgi:2-polyprenyl-3-methyl-5-hydroxy-6-metoxy-1,4-benzoquinol methylase
MSQVSWEEAVRWLREQPEQADLVRACYYDDPVLEAAKRFAASDEWQAVTKLLAGRSGSALDLGAGRGISSYALATSGWQVTALEPDPSDLVGAGAIHLLAKESGLPITVVQGIAEEMDFGDGMFDLVYTREVLHHARDLKEMCRQVARALKPGGVFLACREHIISQKSDLPAFLEAHPLHHLYGGENAYLLNEYLEAIRAAGMRVREILGSHDSIINYFPHTDFEILRSLQFPITKYLGDSLTGMLLHESLPWTALINKWLAKRASKKNISPGKLCTFVCEKPSSRKGTVE